MSKNDKEKKRRKEIVGEVSKSWRALMYIPLTHSVNENGDDDASI
jgi:hypothetical protein